MAFGISKSAEPTSAPVQTVTEKEAAPNGLTNSPNGHGHGHGIDGHGIPELIGTERQEGPPAIVEVKRSWFRFMKTREFYIALVLSQCLSLCLTATNTFTSLLQQNGWSVPAFQTFINYALLNLVFTPYTIYKLGFKGWAKLVLRDGWKYLLFSFFDVEGNYFIVLAYRYTNIMSISLINFTSIVVVVIISFAFLRVRYHWTQILGVLVSIGGVGVLVASDRITGSTSLGGSNQVKGDLFGLLAASCYGFSNIAEEFLVSKATMYEVLGQLGFFGMIINGVQSGIFDRSSFRAAQWSNRNGGYLAGYNICLFLFYLGVPVLMRITSAAFFNIAGLTGAFWGLLIGIKVFGYTVYYLYPIAFVMIILGCFCYFLMSSYLGEANKPWLGANQEKGVSGLGTGRRKLEKIARQRGETAVV
ncbi:MAG: hypothetical protein M1814_005180 [Vezdaea aestivalis]|nr:MAG: hypothetical protein M1814_005180 [Vezdaea aestivalis]